MLDKVELMGMEFFGYHGCMKEERAIGQRFYVDVVMYLDLAPAGKSDDLKETVNYADVFAEARAIVEGEPYTLYLTLSEKDYFPTNIKIVSDLMVTEAKLTNTQKNAPLAFDTFRAGGLFK